MGTPGRPKLDTERVKVVVGVRVLPSVRDRLAEEFGTAGKGMARLVDEWSRDPRRARRDPRSLASLDSAAARVAAGDVLVGSGEQTAGPHRHRRGEKVATTYEMGIAQQHYACAEPGCDVTLHGV